VGRFDLVIFDNDGVLVDSEEHANRVLALVLAEAGYSLGLTPEESQAEFLGLSLPAICGRIEARLGTALPPGFAPHYEARLMEAFVDLAAVPGVERALDAITLPTCVASSGSHARIRRALTVTGLLPRFEGRIFSAQDVTRGKPAPDLFLHAARALGVAPHRCAVIEDSPRGVEAANNAGMIAFGFARVTPADRLREARGGVFHVMDALPGLLAA